MLLTDEEKNAVYLQWLTRTGDMLLLIDLTEAAILAKLASAELPEPAIFQYDAMLASPIKAYTADQLRQAYAQGAAAQLAEKPTCWVIFTDGGNARMWSTFQPHVQKLADAEGLAVTELYTRRQA